MGDIRNLLAKHGSGKPIGTRSEDGSQPHYFLLRKFIGAVDFLIIFNTRRCRYQCLFCNLPEKNTFKEGGENISIYEQFLSSVREIAPAMDIVDRVTFSNEGSVMDLSTFPQKDWTEILAELRDWRSLSELVFETRVEFATQALLEWFDSQVPRYAKSILIGFESSSERVRNEVLGKREPLAWVQQGIDRLADLGWGLHAYVLYKPDPSMTDDQADEDAIRSVEYLRSYAGEKGVPLTIRLNLMYVADGTAWAKRIDPESYSPPSLARAIAIANHIVSLGVPCYLGLSSEGLADEMLTYRARADFNRELLKQAISFNHRSSADRKAS